MAPEWIYLLKVNAGIALFYAFYKLFCQHDTFFQWRRFALLGFLVVSFAYPLLNIQPWIEKQSTLNELADYYTHWIMEEEASIAQTPVMKAPETPDLMTLCIYIYLFGVVILTLRFLIQLFSICRMRWSGKPMMLDGVRIISLPTEVNPFSFFGWIFLHLPLADESSRKEILMHEQTHARQWHSADVVLSEIVNIICWFNPFSWLLKGEIRLNLEYLADNKVTESTNDCKQYQYHLLGLAHTQRKTGLYNNFNVSHLKNRIIMMNKKRTRTAGRIKYALFAPLAAALLLVSNISCISSGNKEEIHQVVEEMPEFPGGMQQCMYFLSTNIKYPEEAIQKNIEGRVIVQMVIKKDGSIADAKVVRHVDPLLDAEALRVVNLMPKWKPGKVKGEAVNVKYTLPVWFRLSLPDTKTKDSTYVKGGVEYTVLKVKEQKDENGVYHICDVMPEFPGGMAACMKFLAENINYPEDCKKGGIQGCVIAQITIEKDGSISQTKIMRSVHPSLDKEALRVINSMPKWIPGKHEGQNVACRYTFPVLFKLK